MIYLISAMLLSTVAMALAGHCAALGRFLWSALAVLLVSAVGGARDLDVSYDMTLYGNGMFERVADARNFSTAIAVAGEEILDPEIGYVWLNYVVAQGTTDPHVFYFVLSAVCASIIAFAISQVRSYGPMWFMWLTYLCTAYIDSFNLLRQGPALAFTLLGIALVMRKRYVWGAIAGVMGLLFHLTALIFIPMWAAAVLIRRYAHTSRKIVGWVIAATLAVSAGASLLLDALGGALSDTKYIFYLQENSRGGIELGAETLYRIIPLVLAIVLIRRETRAQKKTEPLTRVVSPRSRTGTGQIAMVQTTTVQTSATLAPATVVLIALASLLAIELVILPTRELAFGLYRVPLYFGFTRILGYGVILGAVVKNRVPVRIAGVIFVVAYFFLVVIGRSEFEYESSVLDEWFRN